MTSKPMNKYDAINLLMYFQGFTTLPRYSLDNWIPATASFAFPKDLKQTFVALHPSDLWAARCKGSCRRSYCAGSNPESSQSKVLGEP